MQFRSAAGFRENLLTPGMKGGRVQFAVSGRMSKSAKA